MNPGLNPRWHLFYLIINHLPGYNEWDPGNFPAYPGKEAGEAETAGHTGEMGIKIIGLFGLADEHDILHRYIGAQVKHLHAMRFHQVIHI